MDQLWAISFRRYNDEVMKNRSIFLFTKRRVVFHKMTACFSQNDVSFLGNLMKGEEAR